MEVQQKPKKKPKKQTAKKSAKQIDLSQRRWLVLELRKQGATYRQIAEQLVEEFGESGEHGITKKYDQSVAYDDFKAVIKELNERNIDEMEDNRRIDLERLDALLAGSFDLAEQGNPDAFSNVMEVITKRAAWFGYNAPTKSEVSGPNGGAIQLEAVIDAGISKIYGDDGAEN